MLSSVIKQAEFLQKTGVIMTKNQTLATYEYNTPAKSSVFLRHAHIPLLFSLPFIPLVIAAIVPNFPWVFWSVIVFGALFVLRIILSVIAGTNKAITVGSEYFLLGSQVIFYKNITFMKIDYNDLICHIECKDMEPEALTIEGHGFSSNANKEWKIKNHQTKKFVKVTTKLKERLQRSNPEARSIIKGRKPEIFG
jgi:hypothetical protein